MRFFKTIAGVACVTLVALVYVHQQVELVKLSYAIECKEKKLKEILDHNEGLGYTIENLEDPGRLEQVLIAKKIDIGFPKPDHVVNVAKADARGQAEAPNAIGLQHINILNVLEFFTSKAEAQTRDR